MPSSHCPDVGCELVRTPGCIQDSDGECETVVPDVCTKPDVLSETSVECNVPIVDRNVTCILDRAIDSDMCASVFTEDCDGTSTTDEPTTTDETTTTDESDESVNGETTGHCNYATFDDGSAVVIADVCITHEGDA